MFDYVIKKVLSLAISALLIYVPKEKVLQDMASMPTIEERTAGQDLKGWTLKKATSEKTGITHYYFHYPSSAKAAIPLVCIHGFNTDGRVFLNLKELSDTFQLIAYNLPEKTPYYTGNMSDFTVIVDDFMQTLALDTVLIAGNSVGGGIALQYCASTKKTTVAGLVLLSTAVFGATPQDMQRYRGMADKLLPYEDYKLHYLLEKGQSIVGHFERTELGNNAPGAVIVTKKIDWYRQILKSLYNYNGVAIAQQVRCPVLAIHGTLDKVISPESAQTIPKYIAHAQLITIAGVGHSMVYSDAPKVAEKIRSFVKGYL